MRTSVRHERTSDGAEGVSRTVTLIKRHAGGKRNPEPSLTFSVSRSATSISLRRLRALYEHSAGARDSNSPLIPEGTVEMGGSDGTWRHLERERLEAAMSAVNAAPLGDCAIWPPAVWLR